MSVFLENHPAAPVSGAVPLDAETSWQWILGLRSTPFDNFTFTLDYCHIEVDDRFSVSSEFQAGPAEFGICCGFVVRTSSLIDWQGPYFYLMGRVRWNWRGNHMSDSQIQGARFSEKCELSDDGERISHDGQEAGKAAVSHGT